MSQDNGQAGVIRQVASRLRGNGELQKEDSMRDEEEKGKVEGRTGASPPQANHQLPSNAYQASALRPAWGSNASLPTVEVERAVLQRVQERAAVAGKQDVPADIIDFKERANVIFLDKNNQRVSFARVVVAWED